MCVLFCAHSALPFLFIQVSWERNSSRVVMAGVLLVWFCSDCCMARLRSKKFGIHLLVFFISWVLWSAFGDMMATQSPPSALKFFCREK